MELPVTSINYLSTLALERAGIELPAYNQFLADMMETIPAINSRGYYSKSAGGFLHIEEATGEEADWIRNYNILQYNNMLTKRKRVKYSFLIWSSIKKATEIQLFSGNVCKKNVEAKKWRE